jgi:hypothetical protein
MKANVPQRSGESEAAETREAMMEHRGVEHAFARGDKTSSVLYGAARGSILKDTGKAIAVWKAMR